MKPIKFRGKCLNGGEWIYGSLIYRHIESPENGVPTECIAAYILEHELDAYEVEVDPDTIGQFTCAYDRNGKEIYGGDVINDVINNYEYSVFWDTDNHSWHIAEWYNLENYEIVGNIHDKSRTNKEKV